MPIKPIPDGTSTVIPYFLAADAAGLIEFLKQVFAAQEKHRTEMPNGKVMHAHLRIGDSSVMLGQAPPGKAPMSAMIYTYVDDVDAVYKRAIAAGATSINEPADQFYGDRVGAVTDPAGNQWWIATHKEDVSEEEIARRAPKR
ncbi:MAG TPA: VOC family protein [Tepidisphaeraceae bacterium]|jgi:uncharacterized glyoxalase superfamily protein PhnB|nr:VOC family protein [Tepidisphaeraceae bacterium]